MSSPAFNPLGEPTEFAKRRRAILEAWKTGETIPSLAKRLKVSGAWIAQEIKEMKRHKIIKGKKLQTRRTRK